MEIIIVKKTMKWGDRYYAYHSGILSTFGIYCPLNYIMMSGADGAEQCLERAKGELRPAPPKNRQIICKVEI